MIVAGLVICGTVIIWAERTDKPDGNLEIPNPLGLASTPTLSPTLTVSPTPTPTKSSPKSSPGIVVSGAGSYTDWVKWLEPRNQRLVLGKDCEEIVPSQVDYPNNTEIMLDNTFSITPRILKIGDREYSLRARDWMITTLHSDTLPARLPIFCGNMELGQLDLLAK